jgi:hypothetical protein
MFKITTITLVTIFVLGTMPIKAQDSSKDQALLANNIANLNVIYFSNENVVAWYTSPTNRSSLIALLEQALITTDNNLSNYTDDGVYSRFYLVVSAPNKIGKREDKAKRRLYHQGKFIEVAQVSKTDELANKAYLSQLIFRLKNNLALNPIESGENILSKAKEGLTQLLSNN